MQAVCFRNHARKLCYLALIDLINARSLDLS
jgi:hypothetical protein